jgi:hypothetical protein
VSLKIEKRRSRLWILTGNGSLQIGINQVFYKDEIKNVMPPYKFEISRRWFLEEIPAFGIGPIYSPPYQSLRDKQISWKDLQKIIPWETLALIEPQNYNQDYTKNHLYQLRMPQKDFKKWLKNFKNGKFAQ